ncbi:TPA: restriction endonuclease subunit S [Streptococcus suis]|nr:restriction endonuclease subunit S [Streptococcus suis]MDN3007726.1 restriction endonuclease subunit S [Streptococcus suis]NQJ17947.1 restriction endonuclease subunit S [Streptococcus suis]HEL2144031.1 restriction endonuclease subunit S [Streptococcus suis]HEL2222837.1 restriction endonuclease subunit S [Streptococcus suis]HEL2666615.1 restriction endonuclease subunit S [Streptococcus suis]
MNDWKWVKLSEIIDFNPKERLLKGSISKKIAMEKIEPFTRDISEFERLEFKGGTKFRNGDTLIARITPSLENGKTAKVNLLDEDEIGFGSTEFIVARAKKGISDENFVYYLMLDPKVREVAIKSMVGTSGRQRVQLDVVQNYEILCPPLEEQIQIGRILSVIDDKIENNKKINHHLLEQARLLYKNLISSNDTKYQNLSDIARITMGQSPKGETYNDDKIGLPLLNGATDFRNSISPSKWTSDPRKIARPGEYVFGVRATIGLTTKIFKEYAIGRGTGSAKPISNIFDEYLFFALEDLFDYYANLGSGTVYINISKSDFDSFKVILPIKDQFLVDFHKTVQPLFNLIFNNNAEIQKLSELRDCLLPKLLSGEISINQATK